MCRRFSGFANLELISILRCKLKTDCHLSDYVFVNHTTKSKQDNTPDIILLLTTSFSTKKTNLIHVFSDNTNLYS